jgi:hypothetical protein
MTEQVEEINGFGTKSFWLIVLSVVIPAARTYGFDLSSLGIDESMIADFIMIGLPVLLGVWAYVERIYGKKKLKFRRWLKRMQA